MDRRVFSHIHLLSLHTDKVIGTRWDEASLVEGLGTGTMDLLWLLSLQAVPFSGTASTKAGGATEVEISFPSFRISLGWKWWWTRLLNQSIRSMHASFFCRLDGEVDVTVRHGGVSVWGG